MEMEPLIFLSTLHTDNMQREMLRRKIIREDAKIKLHRAAIEAMQKKQDSRRLEIAALNLRIMSREEEA